MKQKQLHSSDNMIKQTCYSFSCFHWEEGASWWQKGNKHQNSVAEFGGCQARCQAAAPHTDARSSWTRTPLPPQQEDAAVTSCAVLNIPTCCRSHTPATGTKSTSTCRSPTQTTGPFQERWAMRVQWFISGLYQLGPSISHHLTGFYWGTRDITHQDFSNSRERTTFPWPQKNVSCSPVFSLEQVASFHALNWLPSTVVLCCYVCMLYTRNFLFCSTIKEPEFCKTCGLCFLNNMILYLLKK